MKDVQFNRHSVPARKDLLHFVEKHAGQDLLKRIGQNPCAWTEELNTISNLLNHEPLVCIRGMDSPPQLEPEFQHLGSNAYLYTGRQMNLRGLWLKKEDARIKQEHEAQKWSYYHIGMNALLKVSQEFESIPFNSFLPEVFERAGERVVKIKKGSPESEKRPIFRFSVPFKGKQLSIYAKGVTVLCSYYYEYAKPLHRLTSLCDVMKITSQKEAEINLQLMRAGIHVPTLIGLYQGPVEEFVFFREVSGRTIDAIVESERETVIEQDAHMLAVLCLLGLHKSGFADSDDKIFDGTHLYLIDVEECGDLYFPANPDFRSFLLNPCDTSLVRKFRKAQRCAFTSALKDVLFSYQESLTPTRAEQGKYIRAFYSRIGWKEPSERAIEELTYFTNNYQTADSFMSMMSEPD